MPTPLFLAPAVCGGAHMESLAEYLDLDSPIYLLPFEQGASKRTAEGTAMRMIQAIRSIQPSGPYRIAGYAYGGILAYEIATQLLGADDEVAFVGLIDCPYYSRFRELSHLNSGIRFDADTERLFLPLLTSEQCGPPTPRGDRYPNLASGLEERIHNCQGPSQLYTGRDCCTREFHADALTLVRQRITAAIEYCALPIPIRIHLFVSAQFEQYNLTPPERLRKYLDWDSVLPKNQICLVSVEVADRSATRKPAIEFFGKSSSLKMEPAGESSLAEYTRNYYSLHLLKAGRFDRELILCVPGAGGSFTMFVDLVNSLDTPAAIYGIQPRGLDGLSLPHSTVSAAVEHYLRSIDHLTSNRPIHLIGHSFGGWIAFEMALRLHKRHQSVASVTMIDSESPFTHDSIIREYNATDVIMTWIDMIELAVGRSLGVAHGNLSSLNEMEKRNLLHAVMVREALLPKRTTPDVLRGPLAAFGRSLRTIYTPDSIYPGPVHLVIADDPRLDDSANRLIQRNLERDWRKWAPDLRSTLGPGNHFSILKPPDVCTLADILCRQLGS